MFELLNNNNTIDNNGVRMWASSTPSILKEFAEPVIMC